MFGELGGPFGTFAMRTAGEESFGGAFYGKQRSPLGLAENSHVAAPGFEWDLIVPGPALHAVANVTLKCAFRIEQEVADLLAPEPERLIFPGKNPWDRWLRPL